MVSCSLGSYMHPLTFYYAKLVKKRSRTTWFETELKQPKKGAWVLFMSLLFHLIVYNSTFRMFIRN